MKVNRLHPEPEKIKYAAAVVRAGGVVAFPTETVYGLAADAFNPEAVQKVFAAKERPQDNPLIVHIATPRDIILVARKPSKKTEALIRRFWPGPLTLILAKRKRLPDIVSGCSKTVAVRMPDHKIALALIRAAKTPIVGPSANLSGRPSPTRAEDVALDLGGRIDLIIDGGRTELGIESTVLDMTVSPPAILRYGAVSVEEIESCIGRIALPGKVAGLTQSGPKSPGMKYRHYAPRAEMIIVEGPREAVRKKINELAKKAFQKKKKTGIITFCNKSWYETDGPVIFAGSSPRAIARRLFMILRDMDKEVDLILSESFEEKGVGRAIADRLKKAAGYRIIQVPDK